MNESSKLPDWDVWARYYDLMDGDRDSMIAYYQSLVRPEMDRILELACGTGRVTRALAERAPAARVVGIDEAPHMIELARDQGSGIEWLLGDMRTQLVEGPFDLVVCCYNSVQHMLTDDDLLGLMGHVRSLLKPEGLFAFDIYQPNLPYLQVNHSDRLARSKVDAAGRRLDILESTTFNSAESIYTVDWRLEDATNRQTLTRISYKYRQYTAARIDELLSQAGLRMLAKYGDFQRGAFASNSKKQVVITGR